MYFIRYSGQKGRVKLEAVNSLSTVMTVKRNVVKKVDCGLPENVVLTFAGQCLENNKTLNHYDIPDGSTLYAFFKHLETPAAEKPESMSDTELKDILSRLETVMLNPESRRTLQQILNDKKILDNIVAATPTLASNPIAMGIIYDSVLVEMFAEPENFRKIVDVYPELAMAASAITSVVQELMNKIRPAGETSLAPASYSLDRMSDDEDDGGLAQDGQAAVHLSQITTSQLASALAAVSGSTIPQAGQSTGSDVEANDNQNAPNISAAAFEMAMQQALASAAPLADASAGFMNSSSQPQEERQNQLQLLREMGITDDAMSLRALEVTNGDVQAALELLFGDGL